MSEIESVESIRGSISGESTLQGILSVATGQDYDVYDGNYEVTPMVNKNQMLNTTNKLLTDDLVIAKIPYIETSNDSNGKTVYIGEDV